MKTPIRRLREITKILKNKENLVLYNKLLNNDFFIESLYQPSDRKVLFLMSDNTTDSKMIHLEDEDVDGEQILEIVLDLEKLI